MAKIADNSKSAEAFAHRMEAKMRELGSTDDFFCDTQRERWRQHSIRAYLGLSSDDEVESSSTPPIPPLVSKSSSDSER